MNELLDEVETGLSLHNDIQWLVGNTFTAAYCILKIVIKRLCWLEHDDYMGKVVRPMLGAMVGSGKGWKNFYNQHMGTNRSFPHVTNKNWFFLLL